MFGNVTALEGLHVTETEACSTHAPDMRPGIPTPALSFPSPVRVQDSGIRVQGLGCGAWGLICLGR